ncbi:unnamed protein product [Mytilus coruscus]|uniref:Uncharacterized protein n=1 Tax=Mytilus coruscus TaxID=42192 RepID=A0A6J8BAN0_MYTCO|nr:unnamed protein product [Mytilus coruscus]
MAERLCFPAVKGKANILSAVNQHLLVMKISNYTKLLVFYVSILVMLSCKVMHICPHADTSLSQSLKTMSPVLKKFLCWLLNDDSYETVKKDNELPTEKLRKCMALAETIVSINRNSFTLFILVWHYKCIMYIFIKAWSNLYIVMGCASYNELRRFLTSLADHEIDKIENGTYAPQGIGSYPEEVNVIQEGADYVDINTYTIDGKDTFHSIVRAVFRFSLCLLPVKL